MLLCPHKGCPFKLDSDIFLYVKYHSTECGRRLDYSCKIYGSPPMFLCLTYSLTDDTPKLSFTRSITRKNFFLNKVQECDGGYYGKSESNNKV